MTNIANPIGVFKTLIDNRFMRFQIRNLSSYCEKDRGTRLEIALEIYAGMRGEEDVCRRCRWTYRIIKWLLRVGAKTFGAEAEELREIMKDVYWRRGLANVVKGLGLFGVKKPFVPGAPFLIVWDVTGACNLRCKHCYADAGIKTNELSTDEARRAIDIFAHAGVVSIAFSGGEPLIRPDIYELSKYAVDKGIYVSMATNGTLLNRHTLDKLWKCGVRFLQISLDSADPEIHDEFRGVNGAWNKTVEGIKLAVKKGFFVNIAYTMTKCNIKDVPRMIELAEKLGVRWFMLYNFVPTGRGKEIIQQDLTPEEREEVLLYMWRELQRRNVGLLTTAPYYSRIGLTDVCSVNEGTMIFPTHFQNAEMNVRLVKLTDFIGGCGAGRFYIGLSPNGNIRPCVFMPIEMENILELEDNFTEWWKNNRILNELRNKDRLKGNCGKCEYRYVCGGCRARAYGYYGDYLAPDPGCIINKEEYSRIVKIEGVET